MSKKKEQKAEEKEKKKEQKIIYIDDGSTIADMSGTFKRGKDTRQKSTAKEKAKTFFGVMLRMIPFLLVTLLGFTLVYIILLLMTGKF